MKKSLEREESTSAYFRATKAAGKYDHIGVPGHNHLTSKTVA
jgi:hypothetical protein